MELTGKEWMNEIDSLFLVTTSGTAKIQIKLDSTYEVFNVDSLNKPLSINKDSDLIQLRIFYSGFYEFQDLPIGKYYGSYLMSIPDGYSIATKYSYGDNYYLDSSPTIGTENDFIGATSYIYGQTNLPDHYYFYIDEGYTRNLSNAAYHSIYPDENNYFCTKLVSRSYFINKLELYSAIDGGLSEVYPFKPTSFTLNPGDSIHVDFTLISSDLESMKQSKVFLCNYPNPAKNKIYFVFDLKGMSSGTLSIKVYEESGVLLEEIVPTSETQPWDCSKLMPGTYFYSMEVDHKVVGSAKLLIE